MSLTENIEDMSSKNTKQIKENILSILKVGGPLSEQGEHKKLTDTEIQKKTGIARSTIRNIKSNTDEELNSDLKTLSKIADLMGIPLAFIIMTTEDWDMIFQAFSSMRHFLLDEKKDIINKNPIYSHKNIKESLIKSKILNRSLNVKNLSDQDNKLHSFNDDLLRCGAIIGALLLKNENKCSNIEHIAFATSLANQINSKKHASV